jgi:hypothetical protein
MSEYSELDAVIELADTTHLVNGCQCEPDVNFTCEWCA